MHFYAKFAEVELKHFCGEISLARNKFLLSAEKLDAVIRFCAYFISAFSGSFLNYSFHL